MTPQEIKTSIFQYAVQGKLVEQRSEEGTGEELFLQIQAEKQALVAAGTFKKDKPLPEIADDEIPFDIPDTWKWVHLDDVIRKSIKRGKSPTYTQQSSTLVFAQKCNTKAGYIDLNLALFLDEKKLDKYPDEEFMQDYDIVINSTGNGTLGRVGMYRNTDNPRQLPVVPDSHVTVIRASNTISVEYVYYVLKYYQPYMEKLGTGSTNQTELSANVVRSLLFPLPPVAEQKRIVAKIEELLPLINRYEQSWSKLEEFNKRFPVDMQKSILQMAIQGKLVEQRPEEGTGEELFQQIQAEKQRLIKSGTIKKEKPLPEITEDEIPFDIPDSWKWTKLGRLFVIERGSSPRPIQSYLTSSPDGVNWIKIGDSEVGAKYITSTSEKITTEGAKKSRLVSVGDFIISNSMSYGRPYIMAINGYVHDGWNIIHNIQIDECDVFDKDYLYYVLSSNLLKEQMKAKAAGGVVKNIKSDYLRDLIIPVPPLAEQKRIVTKLEEILPLCERLK